MTYETHDSILFSKVSNNNQEAFNELYSLYAPRLYHRLLRLLKNPDVVEEILQEVFVKIWKKRHDIMPEKGFKTYVCRMADNMAIDHLRKMSREKIHLTELWADSLSCCIQDEEAFRREEQLSMLQEAIEQLPPKRREILLLCNIEGKSYKYAAETLGITVSTVSNQLVSAMKDIKTYITRRYKNECLLFLFSIITLA